MWVDDTAGDDPTSTDDMTITVEGEEYSAEVNYDMSDDGIDDTAVIERSDGSYQVFVDEDGDGEADVYGKFDENGNLVAEAQYDDVDGTWVAAGDGGDVGGSDEPRTSSDGMTADLPSGEVAVGQPTIDTNNDGVADTAVVEDNEGNTLMFTDMDGDGEADVVVVVTPSGDSTTLEYTGDGEWVQIDSSTVDDSYGTGGAAGSTASNGSDEWGGSAGSGASWGAAGWGAADGQGVSGVAHIDPATGQWTGPN